MLMQESVCEAFYAHFRSYTFFVRRYHTSCLSTDAWFFLFPAILAAQVLVGSMRNTPSIWVYGIGDFCCYSRWILYIYVWVPGFCTSTQGLHFFIDSLSGLVSSLLSRRPSFFEGRVIGLDHASMRLDWIMLRCAVHFPTAVI